jgi:hypothetical protein
VRGVLDLVALEVSRHAVALGAAQIRTGADAHGIATGAKRANGVRNRATPGTRVVRARFPRIAVNVPFVNSVSPVDVALGWALRFGG